MDWNKCIICGDGGDLKCPAKSLQGNGCHVYQTYLDLVSEFCALGQLPTSVQFQELDVADLLENDGKWHKACHLKFAQSKLERAKKKRRANDSRSESLTPSRKSTRPLGASSESTLCIFCDSTEGPLHE